MRKIDQRNLVFLWLQENGKTANEIAEDNGLALRTVQEALQNARDLKEHLRQKGLDVDDPGWVRVIVTGIVKRCKHGLPGLEDGTWLCEECMLTNNPKHPAFRKGRMALGMEISDNEKTAGQIAKEVQPKGKAQFIPKGAKAK